MAHINQLCWFMENLKSIVVWSVIGAIVVALIILACKSKIALIAELCLICVVILVSGIYTGFYDIRYFINRNSIHGESTEGVHNQTLGSYNELTKTFTFTRFGFAPTTENNKYECILTFQNKSIDFIKEKNLYVNDEACDHITKDTDYIKADYRQIFIDDENNTLCDDTLFITIHSNKNKLGISITTKGGDKAVAYWRSFLIENGFKVSFGKNNRPNNTTIDSDSEVMPSVAFDYKCSKLLNSIGNIPAKNELSKVQELQQLISTYISVNGYDCSTNVIKNQNSPSYNRNNFSINIDTSTNIFYLNFSQILKTTDSSNDNNGHSDRYYIGYNSSGIDTAFTFDKNNNCSFFIKVDSDDDDSDDGPLISYDTNNFYSFLLFRLRNYDKYDWLFDINNMVYSRDWHYRKDIDNRNNSENIIFPVTSVLVIKDSSEDYVKKIVKNILEQALAQLDNNFNVDTTINIDLSNYFYNLIYDSTSNSYQVSNGSIIFETRAFLHK